MKNNIALYLHFPFCVRKCLYCDFCSLGGADEGEMQAYTDALLKELREKAKIAQSYCVDTVFLGGGTPSLMPLSALERIFSVISASYSMADNAEITIEVNPKTADLEKLSAFRTFGINRLSMGVQSFQDNELAALGRVHTALDAWQTFLAARRAGFSNINLDLMYGIPYQTPTSFARTLDEALSLSPEHISAYSLILEEGTPFFEKKDELPLPDEDAEEQMHFSLTERMRAASYGHYEISNYAKEGYACRHNLHYWRMEPYLGFGAAAYSFFGNERYGNTRDIKAYARAPLSSVSDSLSLGEEDLAYDTIMMGLRLGEGIDLAAYEKRFGFKMEERYAEVIERYTALGWMKTERGRLFLSESGMRFSNTVLVDFL